MSFGLYWRPTIVPPSNSLPVELKYVLARRFGEHDGSCREQFGFDSRVTGYLEGLCDACAADNPIQQGARELLAAIAKHGTIEVWIGDADE